jgi:hypothetical protein
MISGAGGIEDVLRILFRMTSMRYKSNFNTDIHPPSITHNLRNDSDSHAGYPPRFIAH